jgi:hypothetical protein
MEGALACRPLTGRLAPDPASDPGPAGLVAAVGIGALTPEEEGGFELEVNLIELGPGFPVVPPFEESEVPSFVKPDESLLLFPDRLWLPPELGVLVRMRWFCLRTGQCPSK